MIPSTIVMSRELLASNRKLAVKLDELERKPGAHDHAINEILQAIRQMMMPSEEKRKRSIGFIH